MKLSKIQVSYRDERGEITDILERIETDCATIITFRKGARRGDHYHKESVQYTYVTRGSLEVLTGMPGGAIKKAVIRPGDLVYNPQLERHAFIALEDSEILVLTRGPRGGKHYEDDTFRLEEKLK